MKQLAIEIGPVEIADDPFLADLPGGTDTLNRSALSGGKKFRPTLLLQVAQWLEVEREAALPYAIAAERVHNATLLHDDVIDESRVRRGKPTLNSQGQNRKAILAGDLLLARTLRELNRVTDPQIFTRLLDVLIQLTEGEWLQLEARNEIDIEARHLLQVARKKTASLIGWCASVPAAIHDSTFSESGQIDRSGQGLTRVDAFRMFGVHLGIAFQMIDDCRDFDPTSGKPFAQDLREGQINFVTRAMLDLEPKLRDEIASILGSDYVVRGSEVFRMVLRSAIQQVVQQAEIELASSIVGLEQVGVPAGVLEAIRAKIFDPLMSEGAVKSAQ